MILYASEYKIMRLGVLYYPNFHFHSADRMDDHFSRLSPCLDKFKYLYFHYRIGINPNQRDIYS